MELKLISKDEHSIEVEIAGETETLLEPLRAALLANPKVLIATFHAEHPWFDNKRIFVKVSEGKPETALKQAAESVLSELGDALEQLEKIKEP